MFYQAKSSPPARRFTSHVDDYFPRTSSVSSNKKNSTGRQCCFLSSTPRTTPRGHRKMLILFQHSGELFCARNFATVTARSCSKSRGLPAPLARAERGVPHLSKWGL